ncbi:MAG: hypothetical protein ACI9EW_002272 [Cellvibrionaceae bacterium]
MLLAKPSIVKGYELLDQKVRPSKDCSYCLTIR